MRLMVGDLDELIVPAVAGTTLPQLLGPGGCLSAPSLRRPACAVLERRNVLPVAAVAGGGGGEARPDEPAWWLNVSGPNPLPRYRWMEPQPMPLPKFLVNPNHGGRRTPRVAVWCWLIGACCGGALRTSAPGLGTQDAPTAALTAVSVALAAVGQIMVHIASVCIGTSSVAGPGSGRLQSPCTSRALCSRASESCAFVAHFVNMLTARRAATNTTDMPPGWLWMLPQ